MSGAEGESFDATAAGASANPDANANASAEAQKEQQSVASTLGTNGTTGVAKKRKKDGLKPIITTAEPPG
jgi:hypothetical protein